MGERLVVISDDQQITNDDLNKIGTFSRSAIDHVVKDGVEPGKKFTGFQVAITGPAQVTVGTGRLYVDGAVYAREDEGGVVVDLLNSLPAVTNKIVTLVVWGQAVDTALEPRTFLVDVDTEQTEARSVATENRRIANVNSVSGVEAAEPSAPAIDANVLAVAYARLTPGGIESVTSATENRLISTRDVANRAAELELWRGRAGARLDVLDTTVAGIQSRINGIVPNSVVYQAIRDVARLKERIELPAEFTYYSADHYLTPDDSDTAHPDFLAKVEEGIRFSPANQRVAQIDLLNPIDPMARKQNNFVLPAYSEIERQKVIGRDGELSISQYQFQTVQTVMKMRSRTRIRYGTSMTVCTNAAWWNDGTYDPATRIFTRGAETFLVDVLDIHPSGNPNHFIGRLTQFWTDTFQEPYWDYETVTEGVSASFVAETFLNAEPGYITAVGLYFTRKAATGDVVMMICETENGKPLFDSAIARVTVPVADLKVYPEVTKVAVPPTFLEKGARYAIVIATAGNHFVATVDGNKNTNGSLFFSTDGAFAQGDLTRDIAHTLYYAQFPSPRVELQLQALQLENGIASIDLNFDSIDPDGTEIVFEVQIGGIWRPLKYYSEGNILNGLLNRTGFAGGSNFQIGWSHDEQNDEQVFP